MNLENSKQRTNFSVPMVSLSTNCNKFYWGKVANKVDHLLRDAVDQRFRIHLHEIGSVWNWYETGMDKSCIYTGPGRSTLDRLCCPVPNGFTCESDSV